MGSEEGSQSKISIVNSPANRHLIGGQCTSLVRADDRRTAKGLDGWQGSHDRVLLRHTTRAQGQTRGDHGRQTFGDGGYGKSDGYLEIVDGALDP